jgi:hypothetical protein
MTRIRDRWQQCHGKVKHGDRESARAAREDMAARPGREELIATLTPYLCPHCNCWHLGTAHDKTRRLKQFHRRAEKQRRKAVVAAAVEGASE